jgi:hypothetical protein
LAHKIDHADTLGPPAIKIAGFQLWIHSRQFPDAQDYWDGNWLNVTAHCGANGASVWACGAILMIADIAHLAADCERLYEGRQEQAILQPCEPNLLVSVRSSDRLGHLTMHVEITNDHMTQQHTFDFEIDQSYLPSLIAQCKAILEDFPVRGNPDGV